uniref:Uncharacterized protein n=1 Tax=Anopheles farauti TaxID=69004 RepID=A0A182R0R4_9DIPT
MSIGSSATTDRSTEGPRRPTTVAASRYCRPSDSSINRRSTCRGLVNPSRPSRAGTIAISRYIRHSRNTVSIEVKVTNRKSSVFFRTSLTTRTLRLITIAPGRFSRTAQIHAPQNRKGLSGLGPRTYGRTPVRVTLCTRTQSPPQHHYITQLATVRGENFHSSTQSSLRVNRTAAGYERPQEIPWEVAPERSKRVVSSSRWCIGRAVRCTIVFGSERSGFVVQVLNTVVRKMVRKATLCLLLVISCVVLMAQARPNGKEWKHGGGKDHHSEEHSSHGEKGEKGYKKKEEHDEGKKGHHDKEGHKKEYHDEGGHKKKHHDEGGYHHESKKGEKGEKGHKFEESGHFKKGHSTKGHHEIHKKDEFKKEKKFFDEDHDEAFDEKHGDFHEEHGYKKGGSEKGGHKKGGHHHDHYGKKGHKKKGSHHHDHKGHKEEHGHDKHWSHKEDFGKKGGNDHHKKWGHKKGGH